MLVRVCCFVSYLMLLTFFIALHSAYLPTPRKKKAVDYGEREERTYMGVWGCTPSGVQGLCPWSGGLGGKAPLKLSSFLAIHIVFACFHDTFVLKYILNFCMITT